MKKNNEPIRPQAQFNAVSRMPRGYYVIAAVCCTLLAAGFFFAARQHFSSINYGIINSQLRKQIDELESEKRRLLVAKETSLTPAELRKAAKRIGNYYSAEVQAASTTVSTISTQLEKKAEAISSTFKPVGNKIVPIVMTAPVVKPAKQERQARMETVKDKKNRT